MKADIPDPNPGLAEWMVSEDCRRPIAHITDTGHLLFQAKVAKRTGRLAGSAHSGTAVEPAIGGSPRWTGTLTVGGASPSGVVDYAAAHQYGYDPAGVAEGADHVAGHDDLNFVLENLGGYL